MVTLKPEESHNGKGQRESQDLVWIQVEMAETAEDVVLTCPKGALTL